MDKRLLLIEPPFYRLYEMGLFLCNMPLGLGYLAGAVQAHTDWSVKVLNADFDPNGVPGCPTQKEMAGEGYRRYLANLADPGAPFWQEVKAHIQRERPTVMGISCKSQNFASARMLARLAKSVDPEMVVVVGGPHPSMAGETVFQELAIDVSVLGEGEATLPDLLDALVSGRDLANVPGILYRELGGTVARTPRREFIQDIDSLGYPHQAAPDALIGYESYPKEAFGFIFATRGCPFNCQYCGSRYLWSRKVRFRSPANVVEELRLLAAKGLTRIHFEDDTFGVVKAYLLDLCKAIRDASLPLEWSCEISVKLVDDEVVAAMRAAGCWMIILGIESGNDAILASIRKGITVEQSCEAAKVVKRHGVKLYTFFMVGFARETRQSLEDTFNLMRSIGSDHLIYSVFTPYPGTDAFAECRDLGLVGEDFDVSLYNHQSPENCFCANIPKAEFRALAGEIEAFVDQYNAGRG